MIYLDAKESQELMKGEEGDLLGIKQKKLLILSVKMGVLERFIILI